MNFRHRRIAVVEKPVERALSAGIMAALGEHPAIGAALMMVSLARSYLLRRLFEAIRIPSAE